MALTQHDVIDNYMVINDMVNLPNTVAMHRKIALIFPNILRDHAMRRDWSWRKNVEVELTVDTGHNYVDAKSDGSTALKNIVSARVGTSANLPFDLTPQKYSELMSTSTSTTSTPVRAMKQGTKIYPYRPPSVGTVITVIGDLDTSNTSSILSAISADHEEALHRYIDFKLGRQPFDYYMEAVMNLYGDEPKPEEEFGRDEELIAIQDNIGNEEFLNDYRAAWRP